jgi:hypothetical protein
MCTILSIAGVFVSLPAPTDEVNKAPHRWGIV